MNRLLLDTNVVIWLLLGAREEVSPAAVAALEEPGNDLLISAASVWEIAIKRSLRKLRLPDSWSTELARLDFVPLPVNALHAAAVERLPWHHRDPFDRLLVAQALEEGAAIVSRDATLEKYGVHRIWGGD